MVVGSLDRRIALAVVQYLQDHLSQLPEAIEPSFNYAPSIDLAIEKKVRVVVAPRDRNRTRLNRGTAATRDHLVQLAILQKLPKGAGKGEFNVAEERVDQLVDLLESIDDIIMGQDMAEAAWLSSATDPLYDPALIRSKGVFFGVLTVNYRLVR